MILNKLVIENFRSYQNKTTFNFSGDKNINIIIGQNGTGKTSFLSAIKYALFGSRMFGSDAYTNDYVSWATNERNFNSTNNQFYVEVYFVEGNDTVKVKRKSTIEIDSYKEDVEIIINEEQQVDTRYLESLDYNLFNNIFFNGETISTITNSTSKIQQFTKNMIDVYFELEPFEKIIKDSKMGITKEIKKVSTDKYQRLQSEIKKINREIEQYQLTHKTILAEMQKMKINSEAVAEQMKKLQMVSSDEEEKIKVLIAETKSEINQIETNMRRFLKYDIPALLIKPILTKYNHQLKKTRSMRKEQIIQIYEMLAKDDFNFDAEGIMSLKVETDIAKASNTSKEQFAFEINQQIKQKSILQRRLTQAENKLATSEKGKKHLSYVTNLEFFENEYIKLKQQEQLITEKLELAVIDKEELLLKQEDERQLMLSNSLAANAIKEKEKLIEVCERYLLEKRNRVFKQVANYLQEILKNELLRKQNLVDSITIEDYQVKIISNNKERAIKSYSSGEQQVFLIGLIFSVLTQAEIEVPLILDTFFARLDDVQQDNLINYINDKISNQVLFVSTDSELPPVKQAKFSNVNRKYYLKNNGYQTELTKG